MPKVEVYTRPACGACEATKTLLTRGGVEFETIDVSTDPELAATLVAEGWRAMPVVKVWEEGVLVDSWPGLKKDRIDLLVGGYK